MKNNKVVAGGEDKMENLRIILQNKIFDAGVGKLYLLL